MSPVEWSRWLNLAQKIAVLGTKIAPIQWSRWGILSRLDGVYRGVWMGYIEWSRWGILNGYAKILPSEPH